MVRILNVSCHTFHCDTWPPPGMDVVTHPELTTSHNDAVTVSENYTDQAVSHIKSCRTVDALNYSSDDPGSISEYYDGLRILCTRDRPGFAENSIYQWHDGTQTWEETVPVSGTTAYFLDDQGQFGYQSVYFYMGDFGYTVDRWIQLRTPGNTSMMELRDVYTDYWKGSLCYMYQDKPDDSVTWTYNVRINDEQPQINLVASTLDNGFLITNRMGNPGEFPDGFVGVTPNGLILMSGPYCGPDFPVTIPKLMVGSTFPIALASAPQITINSPDALSASTIALDNLGMTTVTSAGDITLSPHAKTTTAKPIEVTDVTATSISTLGGISASGTATVKTLTVKAADALHTSNYSVADVTGVTTIDSTGIIDIEPITKTTTTKLLESTNSTDATAYNLAAFVTAGGIATAKKIWSGDSLVISYPPNRGYTGQVYMNGSGNLCLQSDATAIVRVIDRLVMGDGSDVSFDGTNWLGSGLVSGGLRAAAKVVSGSGLYTYLAGDNYKNVSLACTAGGASLTYGSTGGTTGFTTTTNMKLYSTELSEPTIYTLGGLYAAKSCSTENLACTKLLLGGTDGSGLKWMASYHQSLIPEIVLQTTDCRVIKTSSGASIAGGKLFLNSGCICYALGSPADNWQYLCVKFKYTAGYNGFPGSTVCIFSMGNVTTGQCYDGVILQHNADGSMYLMRYDHNGNIQMHVYLTGGNVWSATAGTEYCFEMNFDMYNGLINLFIDGVLKGSGGKLAGVNSAINNVCIGANYNLNYSGKITGYFRDVQLYDTIQHTVAYDVALFGDSITTMGDPGQTVAVCIPDTLRITCQPDYTVKSPVLSPMYVNGSVGIDGYLMPQNVVLPTSWGASVLQSYVSATLPNTIVVHAGNGWVINAHAQVFVKWAATTLSTAPWGLGSSGWITVDGTGTVAIRTVMPADFDTFCSYIVLGWAYYTSGLVVVSPMLTLAADPLLSVENAWYKPCYNSKRYPILITVDAVNNWLSASAGEIHAWPMHQSFLMPHHFMLANAAAPILPCWRHFRGDVGFNTMTLMPLPYVQNPLNLYCIGAYWDDPAFPAAPQLIGVGRWTANMIGYHAGSGAYVWILPQAWEASSQNCIDRIPKYNWVFNAWLTDSLQVVPVAYVIIQQGVNPGDPPIYGVSAVVLRWQNWFGGAS